jgi:hypothetical protein
MVSSVRFEPDGTAAGPVSGSHVRSREAATLPAPFGWYKSSGRINSLGAVELIDKYERR